MTQRFLLSIIFILLTSVGFAQTYTDAFTYDNVSRDFTVHVPAIYDGNTAVPLLVSLHGLGDNMANFSNAGFHQLSETANFIVVTPQALDFAFAGFSIGAAWNSGVGAEVQILSEPIFPNEDVDDVGFISTLIDSLAAQYNIDLDRVYATGFSMGGFMSNRLAVELNDKIAAIASVSGTLGDNVSRDNNPCPIPVMHIHGTADATIDYNADYQGAGGLYTIVGDSVSGLMNFWNTVNQTNSSPLYNANYATIGGFATEEFIWEDGVDSTVVRHLKINGGGHDWWPNVFPSEIWNFLSVHKNQEMCEVINSAFDRAENIEWNLYPNPSAGSLNITIEESIEWIGIFDVQGKLVQEETSSSFSIDALPLGTYFIQVQTPDAVLQKTVIKH